MILPTPMKTRQPEKIYNCPYCGRKTSKNFGSPATNSPPLAFLLRQALKRKRGKPVGRNWRTDPRPRDSIAILDRAYYDRPNNGDMNVPTFRRVVRVSNKRVFYTTED